ncbi:MAG: hypothetical protein JSS12_10390 [Verrucomicrobia bacterium]|nr:hypothetical protein [Verrucomicrobiota bacterium]
MYLCFIFALFFCCGARAASERACIDDRINNAIARAQYRDSSQEPRLEAVKISVKEGKSNYKLIPYGFNPGDCYTLYRLNASMVKEPYGQYKVNEQGQLLSTKNDENLQDRIVVFGDHMNGECSYLVLVADNKRAVAALCYPNPIEYTWDDGATFWLELTTGDCCRFAFFGKGFKPNEDVTYISRSYDEVLEGKYPIAPEGKLIGFINPSVIGKTGGTASLTIKRKNSDEVCEIKYSWGTEAMGLPN